MSIITDTLVYYFKLGHKVKTTPSGWISGNAVCCHDTKGRGGILVSGDAISYHCFNCGFKTGWQPGRLLGHNMCKLMTLLHIDDDIQTQLRFEALRSHEQDSILELKSLVPTFTAKELPDDAILLSQVKEITPELIPIFEYLHTRHIYLDDFDFYWSPKYSDRVIIPFYLKNQIVGWTGRSVIPGTKNRYHAEQHPGYVFNLDRQTDDRKFVIVCEGAFDAISIDGCAILGSEIKDSHDWQLQQLRREIILVPDRDHAGLKTVEQAIDASWSVSMPNWPEGIKDINEATGKLGRMAVLWMILAAKESYALKIKVRAKIWFKGVK